MALEGIERNVLALPFLVDGALGVGGEPNRFEAAFVVMLDDRGVFVVLHLVQFLSVVLPVPGSGLPWGGLLTCLKPPRRVDRQWDLVRRASSSPGAVTTSDVHAYGETHTTVSA